MAIVLAAGAFMFEVGSSYFYYNEQGVRIEISYE